MTEHSFWLATETAGSIFAHWFDVASHRAPPVVLCHPIGPEYMHCHTALRQLALQLQAAGQASLMFDLPGYGNSSGQLTDPTMLDEWQQTVITASDWVNLHTGQAPILLALRASCLLTPAVIAQRPLAGLVWWYPHTRGQTFVRDLNLIDLQLHSQAPADSPCLTGGGYPMHRDTAAQLEQQSLAVDPGYPLNTLVIHTPEQKRIAALSGLEAAGGQVERVSSSALSSMARQAEVSAVPQQDIDSLIAWLGAQPGASTEGQIEGSLPEATWQGKGFSEAAMRAGAVFGVLTRPLHGTNEAPWVLIPNTGAGHHAGPNRLHVDLARQLARQGISSVRLDLRHLGDSPHCGVDLSNEAYNLTGRDDLAAMTRAVIELGAPSVTLLGLCAGAYNAFQAALAHPELPIASLTLINAQTLYWEPGEDSRMPAGAYSALTSAQYSQAASDPKAWLRLLTSPRKWLNVGRHLARRFGTVADAARNHMTRKLTPLERDLSQLTSRGLIVRFVFSPDEPGIAALSEAGARTLQRLRQSGQVHWDQVDQADHTFTTGESRQRLIDHLVGQLDTAASASTVSTAGLRTANQAS